MNNVFRLVNPVYDMDTYIFKTNLFTKQAKSGYNTVIFSSFRVVNMWLSSAKRSGVTNNSAND